MTLLTLPIWILVPSVQNNQRQKQRNRGTETHRERETETETHRERHTDRETERERETILLQRLCLNTYKSYYVISLCCVNRNVISLITKVSLHCGEGLWLLYIFPKTCLVSSKRYGIVTHGQIFEGHITHAKIRTSKIWEIDYKYSTGHNLWTVWRSDDGWPLASRNH